MTSKKENDSEREEKLFFIKECQLMYLEGMIGKQPWFCKPPPFPSITGSGKDYEQMVKSLGNRIFTGCQASLRRLTFTCRGENTPFKHWRSHFNQGLSQVSLTVKQPNALRHLIWCKLKYTTQSVKYSCQNFDLFVIKPQNWTCSLQEGSNMKISEHGRFSKATDPDSSRKVSITRRGWGGWGRRRQEDILD